MRHTAFKRGSAYLERYCMLIAFAAYLDRNRPSGYGLSFRQWVASRPDIVSVRARARQTPSVSCGSPVPGAAEGLVWRKGLAFVYVLLGRFALTCDATAALAPHLIKR